MEEASSVLADVDEGFLTCAVCHNRYNEPRLLPCLHRCCATCVEDISGGNNSCVTCPECNEEFSVPEEGFKTDFYVQRIIEFLQLKSCLEGQEEQTCSGCGNSSVAIAFCFVCNGYLCSDCHKVHKTMNFLKAHKEHILSVEDVKSENMTLQKVFSLQAAPRCHEHPENASRLCCKTCSQKFICVTCTFGKHKGHEVEDVSIFAATERDRLKEYLDPIIKGKDRVYQMKDQMAQAEEEITAKAKDAFQKLQNCCNEKIETVDQKTREVDDRSQMEVNEAVERHELDLKRKQELMEQELQRVRGKWEKVFESDRHTTEAEVQAIQERKEQVNTQLLIERKTLEGKVKYFENSTESMKAERLGRVQEISQHFKNTIKVMENLQATGDHILDFTSDWTAVGNVDEICAATGPLLEKMTRKVPNTKDMTSFSSTHALLDKIVDIRECKVDEDYEILGVASTGDGSLVFSAGKECTPSSTLTVVDEEGNITITKKLKGKNDSSWYRTCAAFDESRVATVCKPDEVGLFDVCDGSYKKRNFSKLFREDSEVTCVAADYGTSLIVVGCTSSKVHIFEGNAGGVKHLRGVDLPADIIHELSYITLNSDTILGCDARNKKAYAISVDGDLRYKFTPPCVSETTFRPTSICVDRNGFIYMLWRADGWENKSLLVHYARQNGKIISTSGEDEDGYCITMLKKQKNEKLVMVTKMTGKLIVYDIISIDM